MRVNEGDEAVQNGTKRYVARSNPPTQIVEGETSGTV